MSAVLAPCALVEKPSEKSARLPVVAPAVPVTSRVAAAITCSFRFKTTSRTQYRTLYGMSTLMAPSQTATRSRLSPDQVAAAALELLDRDGLEALSMRRLAEQLGVGTMTLYGYFRSKDELLDAVVDAAVAERAPFSFEGTWKEQIRRLMQGSRRNLGRHPGLVKVRADRPVLQPEALRFAETGVTILRRAGFGRTDAARAFRLLFTYVFGYVSFSPDETADQARRDSLAATVALPPDEYPTLRETSAELADAMAGEETFDFGLDRIIDGLEARLANGA
jgi:AcrR family transcriptional regulator